MKLQASEWLFDLSEAPQSLAITLDFEGEQPNHFGAQRAAVSPMKSGSFVGDTRQGGSCNAQDVTLNPHCNGTHTESISHIVDEVVAPHEVLQQPLMLAQVITVTPSKASDTSEGYSPPLADEDLVISKKTLTSVIKTLHKGVIALIIRTLPNGRSKQSYQYGVDVEPPFFTHDAMRWLSEETPFLHLLVDFPSVDRLYDDGQLSNHRLFWQVAPGCHQLDSEHKVEKTITEMAYVPNHVEDGVYLLNLQTPKLKLNAVPSHPVIYSPAT